MKVFPAIDIKDKKCITHNLWDQLDQHINGFFERKNLQDLILQNHSK